MAKDLGAVTNAALKSIGEPEITAFDADNILQQTLIEEANNAVRFLLTKFRYQWGLTRITRVTTADITTENAAVTNASTTVNSVTSAGAAADNFGSVTTDMWFRATGTYNSYAISAVSTGASPDTLTLENAYIDSTNTAIGYTIFQDTYDITATNIDEIVLAQYGDGRSAVPGIASGLGSTRLEIVDLQTIYQYAGGDLHRDTSGKPRFLAEIGRDADDNRRVLLWPYPDSQYIIEMRCTPRYTENTTFATNMFGGDAPDLAYDYVEARLCKRAHFYDSDNDGVAYWEVECHGNGRDRIGILGEMVARENREYKGDNAIKVETFRKSNSLGMEVRSQTIFDRTYVR